jgi:FolB domain-containing protein
MQDKETGRHQRLPRSNAAAQRTSIFPSRPTHAALCYSQKHACDHAMSFASRLCRKMAPSKFADRILLPNLPLKACLPDYAWSETKSDLKLQPVTVSLSVHADLSKAGRTDDLDASVSYSDLSKIAQKHVTEGSSFPGGIRQVAAQLLQAVEDHSFPTFQHAFASSVQVQQTKALFQADSVSVETSQPARRPAERTEVLSIHHFRVESLIGVNDFERKSRQPLLLDLDLELAPTAKWQPEQVASLIVDVCCPSNAVIAAQSEPA